MKTRYIFILFSIIYILLFLFCISIGSVRIPLIDTIHVLVDTIFNTSFFTYSESTKDIILELRVPRVLVASVIGAGLAVAGVAIQGLLKNKIADASILGVSSGAMLGITLCIAFPLNIINSDFTYIIVGMVFAFLSLMFILFMSSKLDKNMNTNTIIITGIVFTMLVNSIYNLVISLASSAELQTIVFWSMGSLSSVTMSDFCISLIFITIGTLIILANTKNLDAMALGDDQAYHLGVNIKRTRIMLLIAISLISATCVAIVGNIAFVGLIIPHYLRIAFKSNHGFLIPASVVTGAMFLVVCDLLSRTLNPNAEIPIGVITSFIGALTFIFLLFSSKRKFNN